MKILQLAPRFPFPTDDGGKIGIANIYKEFSRGGADVTLVAYESAIPGAAAMEEAYEFGRPIIIKHSTANTPARIFRAFAGFHSIYIRKHYNNAIKNELNKLLVRENFDIVHADHSCMAPLALFAARYMGVPAGLRLHNIEWLIWKRYAEKLSPYQISNLFVRQQASLLRKEEQKLYAKMDICFAITEEEKKSALELSPEANVVVASAGVNAEEWKPDMDIERNPYEMVLATIFHWRHNRDAVRWFIDKVLPLVRREVPEAFITLIGKEAPPWLSNYKSKGVNPIGYVDNVQPYYNRAGINVAPLFVGAGIRIKILEALAMELPVVATDLSAEGISEKFSKNAIGEGLYLANEAGSFADCIIDLMNNPEKARRAGRKAREFVVSEYSWEKNVGIILDQYKKLTGLDLN